MIQFAQMKFEAIAITRFPIKILQQLMFTYNYITYIQLVTKIAPLCYIILTADSRPSADGNLSYWYDINIRINQTKENGDFIRRNIIHLLKKFVKSKYYNTTPESWIE